MGKHRLLATTAKIKELMKKVEYNVRSKLP